MHVVATAGHVDHGKSTLVRALTGMEPDRWAEERRRGLTIDLGYVWTALPEVGEVAFVDVPGHRRFIGNMLAGLGPAPAVLFVVAADEGWRAQSEEHLAAVDALGIKHGVLAVTRSDLADPGPALAEARQRIAGSSLGTIAAVACSAVTGQGLNELRTELTALCHALPAPRVDGRVRLWVDRSFTIKGSGTVVTGTLGSGTIRIGDVFMVHGLQAAVRGLQTLGQGHTEVSAVARVALNLRGIHHDEISRGDALLTPGQWRVTSQVDVRLGASAEDLPEQVTVHVGTAAIPARVRPLGGEGTARLTLAHALPLEAGDRAILRDPSRDGVLAGATVLDAAPPPLRRRGAAAARARELAASGPDPLLDEVRRRGRLHVDEARALGLGDRRLGTRTGKDHDESSTQVRQVGEWLVSEDAWRDWTDALEAGTAAYAKGHPLDPHPSEAHALDSAGIPDRTVLRAVAEELGYAVREGRVLRPDVAPDLGPARAAVDRIAAHLAQEPFDAPEQHDLQADRLGTRELAAAEALGLLLRIGDGVVLLPTSPARAMRLLAALPQPFTTSEARQALGTTRRVGIPLLEHLDARGWTRRLDATHREVVRSRPQP